MASYACPTRVTAAVAENRGSRQDADLEMNDDHDRPNVAGLTHRDFNRRGTATLRSWLKYWEAVASGRRRPNPPDVGKDAAAEADKVRREIQAREEAGLAGPARVRSW